MIRGYVAIVDGDSPSADVLPGSDSCKKTAVKLAIRDENRSEFYISIKGTDYSFKVTGNVRTMGKRNIASSLLRIGFIVPNLDIVVSGNPEELEAFVYTLVTVKDPRVGLLPPMCFDRTHRSKLKCKYKRSIIPYCEGSEGLEPCDCLDKLCEFCCFDVLQYYSRDDGHKLLNTWKLCIKITEPLVPRYDTEWRRVMRCKGLTAPFVSKCLCDFDLDSLITDPVVRLNSITLNSYLYLKKVDASNAGLVEIPEALGSLPCLTELDLLENRLGQATNWNWLTSPFLRENLRELNLRENELYSIPEPIFGLRNLRCLVLSFNCLSELPTALGNLKFLRELYIYGNKLVFLPGWLYRKERFSTLDVSDYENMSEEDDSDIITDYCLREPLFKTIVKPHLQHNDFETVAVPSLFKIVATYITDNSLAFWEYNIPTMLSEYLEAAYICRCDSVVFPDAIGPVVQCLFTPEALAQPGDEYMYGRLGCSLPIAIRCCSYECYNLIESYCVSL